MRELMGGEKINSWRLNWFSGRYRVAFVYDLSQGKVAIKYVMIFERDSVICYGRAGNLNVVLGRQKRNVKVREDKSVISFPQITHKIINDIEILDICEYDFNS